jgi:prepilin-type N-terminal cleavage/methylation domain-containing protein/prepilin-type processing-associated H-X9-DG protein
MHGPGKTSCRERAFTLIELLVTIGLIALLLTMLFPSLSTARKQAHSVICTSNLSQWGIALQCYLAENNAFIPRRGQGIQPTTDLIRRQDWFNCLPPYVGQPSYREMINNGIKPMPPGKSLFICPSSKYVDAVCFLPYAMNMYLSSWNRPASHNLRDIRRPSITVFMADAPGPWSSTIPASKPYSVLSRHRNRAGLVFLDGHVEMRDGDYLGCGRGLPSPEHPDVRWKTGTPSDNNVSY